MAVDVNAWVPEEWGGAVVTKFTNTSAVDRATSRHEPMSTDVKHVPKAGDADAYFIPKGQAYTLDDNAGDELLLNARKIGVAVPLADEDIKDAAGFVNIVNAKKDAGASGTAILFDNAALAVTGAENGTTVPYTSVYAAATNKSTVSTGATAAAMRDAVLDAIAVAEESEWSDESLAVIASPAFRPHFRSISADGSAGINVYDERGSSLASYPIFWSRGARLSATATQSPTAGAGLAGVAGNAILVVVPRRMLVVGDRERLMSQVTDAFTGPGALSDVAYLKMRTRKAFALGDPAAASVLEIIA